MLQPEFEGMQRGEPEILQLERLRNTIEERWRKRKTLTLEEIQN